MTAKCARCRKEAECTRVGDGVTVVDICAPCTVLVILEWHRRKLDFIELQTS